MQKKYKRMVSGMLRRRGRKTSEPWFIYVLRCCDGTFYTGVTKDLDRRLKMHNGGSASRYTRTRRPVEMIYREEVKGRARALVRECAIKAMSRSAKQRLVGE